ncbi:WD40 repeat-like protein [Sistotremastrum niveocremeum HHB9708]|uniref:WD40 repeat-like protein n=1 Tax=Sistotremastrum niveocremeum HHB9708 TaxID=1314777 RepID=A0A164Z4Q4_9AGAM|nr:WD40 repeat-like protein [Sistotremastrum niveocremeum HHB9708]
MQLSDSYSLATPDSSMIIQRVPFGDKTNVPGLVGKPKAPKRPASPLQKSKEGKRAKIGTGASIFERREPPQPPVPTHPAPRLHEQATHRQLRAFVRSGRYQPLSLSTIPVLKSFVSSTTSDVYKIFSAECDTHFELPFSCSYSSSAKKSGRPLLAVSTELGIVEIIDTSKRDATLFPIPRTRFAPHENAIFDVKWSPDDRYLATASGDSSIRITSVVTQKPLYHLAGHKSTVKFAAWDPNNPDLLSSGGRDGTICLWDIRQEPDSTVDGVDILKPVLSIVDAHTHGPNSIKSKKSANLSRSVTSLVYGHEPYTLFSSGSFDGTIRKWDTRQPTTKKDRLLKSSKPIEESDRDATIVGGGKRARGLSSMALGEGVVWALGIDSKIHTYPTYLAAPFPHDEATTFSHPDMCTSSFYPRIAGSPCGNWLASGSSDGNLYLFDVGSRQSPTPAGIKLQGHTGEICGLDWASGSLATCSDDRTVRVWRPDAEIIERCRSNPVDEAWNWTWAKDS